MVRKKKVNIAIIDADLIGRDRHRFPNLVCEKLSAYWKDKGADVILKTDYSNLDKYDHVYIAKVFTDTPVPEWIQKGVDMETTKVNLPKNIHVGGTGFFFDKAPNLPDEIEHHMPDYDLYNDWIEDEVEKARAYDPDNFNEKRFRGQFKEYTDYSIGFVTRGCFRKCGFCVNKKYNHVFPHSPLEEFYNPERKKICLLDDNFLGCPRWRDILEDLIATGRKFKFKQGLDERLLTDEKCRLLFSTNYDGDVTFAFDNVSDYDVIHEKLKLIRKYNKKSNIKFYVLVGYESTDAKDIENAFIRIDLLLKYGCLPYIMRYQNKNVTPWKESRYRTLYIAIARWCNQPNLIKKMSFKEFCEANQALKKTDGLCTTMQAMVDFEKENPKIAKKYFNKKYKNPKNI